MRRISFAQSIGVAILSWACVSGAQAQGVQARAAAREQIRQTFLNVLGREATDQDVDHHIRLLEERQIGPLEMRKTIIQSDEGVAAVKSVFKREMGRDPTAEELTKAQVGLNQGHSLEDLRRLLRKR